MNNTLLDELNQKLATHLEIAPLKINYQVSTKAKKKYGHCKCVGVNHYNVNISSFILNTDRERDTLCHELCHAYAHAVFPEDRNPHGFAWKELMKLMGYVNVKAKGVHTHKVYGDAKLTSSGDNKYILCIKDAPVAHLEINNGELSITTPEGELFDSQDEEEKYVRIFLQMRK